ncbi:MAG: hypothetical protein AB8H79_13315 [Myxococcota bacterium]
MGRADDWAAIALALCTVGCAPKVPQLPSAVETGKMKLEPEVHVDATMAAPMLEVVLLAGGSRWDPPGQEGRAWVLNHDIEVPGQLDVRVSYDHAWWTLSCAPSRQPTCAQTLGLALSSLAVSVDTVDAASESLREADSEPLVTDVFYTLAFEAHPYGHPPAGRLGALDVAEARLDQWRRDRDTLWTRPTVRVRLSGPDRTTLEQISAELASTLELFPEGPPPDAAMKGPSPSPSPTLAVVPADGTEAALAIGFALPRRPTQTTRLRPDPEDLTRRQADLRCVASRVPSHLSYTTHPQAPYGWPNRLAALNHGVALWTTTGTAADLTALAERLVDPMVPPDEGSPASPCANATPELKKALLAPIVVLAVPPDEDPSAPRVSSTVQHIVLPSPTQGLFQ